MKKRIIKIHILIFSPQLCQLIVTKGKHWTPEHCCQGDILSWVVDDLKQAHHQRDLSGLKKSSGILHMHRDSLCRQRVVDLLADGFGASRQNDDVTITAGTVSIPPLYI